MNSFPKKQFFFLFLIIALDLLIWQIGPLIAIANKFILITPFSRIATIGIFSIVSLFSIFKINIRKINFNKPLSLFDKSLLQAEIKSLKINFANATHFLKTQFASYIENSPHKKIPWYLTLGPSQSGKTTLLSHAELDFIATEQFVKRFTDDTFSSTSCNWWFSSQGVFLDVPGHFIDTDSKETSSSWFELIKLIKIQKKHYPLEGLLLVINIHEIAKNPNNTAYLEALQKKLITLQTKLKGHYPVYLIFTQCDRILGFNEFFSDLGPAERQNYLGFSLHHEDDTLTTTDLFNHEFDHFLKRLNQRLIWRLHQEPHLETRFLIKDFPIQFENLKNTLANIVHQLSEKLTLNKNLPLQSIYFCSGTQKGEQIDKLLHSFSPLRPSLEKNLTTQLVQAKPFFIHQFFNHILTSPKTFSVKNAVTIVRTPFLGYFLILLPPLLASIFWVLNYKQQKNQLRMATQRYDDYQQTIKEKTLSPHALLMGLNSLQTTLLFLDHFHPSISVGGKHAKEVEKQKVEASYQDSLHKKLLPQLFSILEKRILSFNNLQAKETYASLKMYLMLGDASHFDNAYFNIWLLKEGPTLFGLNTEDTKQYYYHATRALTSNIKKENLNQEVIQHARKILENIPYPLLAYELIKANVTSETLSFFKSKKTFNAFYFTENKVDFSEIYTLAALTLIDKQYLNTACNDVATGNWILGKNAQTILTTEEIENLKQEVIDLYLTDYINAWQKFSNTIQLKGFKNFLESDLMLNALTGENAGLIELLQTISKNTAIPTLKNSLPETSNFTAFFDELSKSRLAQFNKASENTTQLTQTINALTRLSHDIHMITAQSNQDATALGVAQQYIQNIASNPITQLLQLSTTFPEPLKSWLENIAFGNWKLLLDACTREMNHTLKDLIMPYYLSTLHERYPLFKNSNLDTKITDFKQFFSPQGLLAYFFNHSLKPFIDTKKPRWSTIKLAGMGLPISNNTLLQLERAHIISRMFFPDGGDDLKIKFFLQPIALMPTLKSISIHYNGKEIIDLQQDIKLSTWIWPSENNNPDVSVDFVNNEGQGSLIHEKGAWAWLRLLDASHLQKTDDLKKFEVTFDLNGNSAKYLLIANNSINPFIAGITDQFRCPEKL
ncbi:MAG: hypothetical protein ACD_44C00039G0001 [uncultured bacterium]|nr:MAG: hypothetical protein ACD_44C00039G0001 [uncultured bacterium]OGT15236.1 MAG: hypothetical protein A3B69_05495 [Gammaproteobacteria bacterium RIFCSPHIGHO2_02_FULL_38_33]OGT69080.1 MAG: hypothetical protein A3I12_05885 [Gammaproteobacteria bacterium RIFCSPLOWO2_02_FULL_38_11]OGT77654.1 MAG: hypothetical protein A3G71_02045 [Gammaproteobacteria bacterium RIFCSPLOWO2_12_FULL_38_14]